MNTRRPRKIPVSARPRVRRGNVQDAARLRQDLVASAMHLFAEGGLGAVSVRAVAARVGVSPMLTYRYFADKAELLGGVCEWVLQQVSAYAESALGQVVEAPTRHRVLIDAVIAYWESHPDHFCLVYGFQRLPQAPHDKSKTTAIAAYDALYALGLRTTAEWATSLNAEPSRVGLANDLRVAMMLGYLHGTMVSTRYPWSPQPLLRATYIEQIQLAVERVLLNDAAPASPK